MQHPEFLILRHGQTEWNRAERVQGRLDSQLTDVGRGHAARQAEILRDFGVTGWDWFASPQGRAMATARIAVGDHQAQIAADARLCEIDLGEWSGKMRDDIRAAAPELFEARELGWYDHAPGGEGLAGVAVRAGAFLAGLQRPSVIVTHGITSRVIRCLALGLPVSDFDRPPGGQGVAHHVAGGQARVIR
ncbi:MAG: broad specificity phosphatase PhoE [Paracoccaceae bacterium]|jgi:broad specificity phosphatase PhoE